MAKPTNNSAAANVIERAADETREKAEQPRGVTLDTPASKPETKVDPTILDRVEKQLKSAKGRAGEAKALLEGYLAGPGHGRLVHGTVNTNHVDVVMNCTCALCTATLKFLGREPKLEFP